MGWVEDLAGTLVALDTAPLIYYLEAHPKYLPRIDPFFQALERGDLRVVTSTITLAEVLTQPLRQGAYELAAQYRDLLLRTDGLDVLPVSSAVAEEAARLRAGHGLRTPDAIQLATGRLSGAGSLLTNDPALARVTDLNVLILDRLPHSAQEPD